MSSCSLSLLLPITPSPSVPTFVTAAAGDNLEVTDGSRSVHPTVPQRKTALLGVVPYAATLCPG